MVAMAAAAPGSLPPAQSGPGSWIQTAFSLNRQTALGDDKGADKKKGKKKKKKNKPVDLAKLGLAELEEERDACYARLNELHKANAADKVFDAAVLRAQAIQAALADARLATDVNT